VKKIFGAAAARLAACAGRFRAGFRNLKVLKKLIILITLILVALCGVSLVAVNISFRIYNNELYLKSAQIVNQLALQTDKELKNIEKFSLSCALDPEVQSQLETYIHSSDYYSQSVTSKLLTTKLLSESVTEDYLPSIMYISPAGTAVNIGSDITSIDSADYDMMLNKAKEAKGGYISATPSAKTKLIYSAREIIGYNDSFMEPLGTLLFSCDMDKIVQADFRSLAGNKSQLYIFSGGRMIYGSGTTAIKLPSVSSEGYSIGKVNGKMYFITEVKSGAMDWTYVSLQPYESLFGESYFLRTTVIICFIVLFGLSLLLTYRIARNITRPIEDLAASMRQFELGSSEGVQTGLSDAGRGDEIGALQHDFIQMTDRINDLVRENYEKQLVIKDTKYLALQSQIEPHFLYNTFSTMIWLTQAKRNQDVLTMIYSLSNLMRNSLSRENIIRLGDELSSLKYYINIQKLRFEERVNFEIKVSLSLNEYLVPKMTLQPLVENSIKYCVEDTVGVCSIVVSAEDLGRDMELAVTDDGPGMEPDFVAGLNRGEITPRGTGIGIKNIDDRVKLLFGESYGVKVTSEKGRGTRVTVTMPKRSADEDE
jgi:two-component system sensor histidine kinase YesM